MVDDDKEPDEKATRMRWYQTLLNHVHYQHKRRAKRCSKQLLSQQGNNRNISRGEVIVYPKRELL